MIQNPRDVLHLFPVRKSKKQKQDFRDALLPYVSELGYTCTVEKGSMGSRNVVIGNPETAKYLITAHYDTPATMFLPNLVTPCSIIVYLLYQLLVVGLFLGISIGLGILAGIAVDDANFAGQVGMLAYWILLLLIMVGPANKNNYNDNTSGVIAVLETAKHLSAEARSNVCFVLFDLEEVGLVGSASYQKAHKKQTVNQMIINLDCIGDGNEIVMFPTKKLKKNPAKMADLRRICGTWGDKSIGLQDGGFFFYPSDQANFPFGVGVGAFRRSSWAGLYYGRIHTNKDTVLDETNVNILRDALSQLIAAE